MIYEQAPEPDFTAHEEYDGVIYHQRGGYVLKRDEATLVPVNRSYRPLNEHCALHLDPTSLYQKDTLLHDTVGESSELVGSEEVITIMGKRLLFLALGAGQETARSYSSKFPDNNQMSMQSMNTSEELLSGLEGVDIDIGIFGSHQASLNGSDSDLDFIAWMKRENRAETIASINDTLRIAGYSLSNDTPRFAEYASKIAILGGYPIRYGEHLAAQRLRWMSPGGVRTSMQCLHSDYGHNLGAEVVNSLLAPTAVATEEVHDLNVTILEDNEPYNFPRLWTVAEGNKTAIVISFNWVHQGMGSDGRNAGAQDEPNSLHAIRVTTDQDHDIFFMKDNGHYLLPASVVSD